MFYKIRSKIIFVKMGLGSGQQQFGKSNKIVLILMPDYLFTSQFESNFSCKSKDRTLFESETKENDPAPEDQMVDPLAILYMVNCTVCQDIEKVACEHPSRHEPETNQHTYYAPILVLGNRN